MGMLLPHHGGGVQQPVQGELVLPSPSRHPLALPSPARQRTEVCRINHTTAVAVRWDWILV